MKTIPQNKDHSRHYIVIFLWVALLSIGEVSAADITVTVKEKGSGVAVEGATVVLDKGVVYDETAKSGQIRFLDIDQPSEIKVLAQGYETLIKGLSQNKTEFTIYIEPLVIEVEGLKVVAARLPEKASKLTLSAPELLETAGSGGDPLKAIAALPGIVVANEGSAEVYMRGSNSNENITWVNNAPVGYLYHFGGLQSTINPSLIEDINVFLGGFPVEYGDALGGVVDARLRTPKNDRMHYQLDVSTIDSAFLLEGPVGNAGDSFFVAGRRSYLDLLLSPSDATEMFADDDDDNPDQVILVPRYYDFQALYHHLLQGGYVDSYIFSASDEIAMDLRSSATSDPELAGELHSKIEYQTIGATWQQRWNREWDSITTFAYKQVKSAVRAGSDASGESFFARVEPDSLYFQPELRLQYSEKTQFSFGVNGSYSKVALDLYAPRGNTENDPDYDFTSKSKYRLKKDVFYSEISPFVKFRQRWSDKLSSQLGLRHTNIKITGGFETHTFSPRATLEYQLTGDTLLTTTWGRYIQLPQGEQVIETFGNPALLVTESEHRIVGIEHQINPLYSIKTEIYHKPMDNLVIAIDENTPPDNYVNKGTGEAYGFDLFLKRKASQGKTGWLSLSWAKSRRTNEITGITREFSGDQPLTITAVWGQPFGGSWKRWDWSIKAEAHSGTPYTEITGRHREDPTDPTSRWIAEYGKHNAERLPTYYKVDLRISREMLYNESKLKFYFDLQNVTFAENIVEYDYGDEYENIGNPTEVIGMPFFPYFGVKLEY